MYRADLWLYRQGDQMSFHQAHLLLSRLAHLVGRSSILCAVACLQLERSSHVCKLLQFAGESKPRKASNCANSVFWYLSRLVQTCMHRLSYYIKQSLGWVPRKTRTNFRYWSSLVCKKSWLSAAVKHQFLLNSTIGSENATRWLNEKKIQKKMVVGFTCEPHSQFLTNFGGRSFSRKSSSIIQGGTILPAFIRCGGISEWNTLTPFVKSKNNIDVYNASCVRSLCKSTRSFDILKKS